LVLVYGSTRVLGEGVVRDILLAASLGESIGMARSLGLESLGVLLGDLYAYGSITDSMLILIDVLIDNCGFNPEDFAAELAERADIYNPLRMYDSGTAEAIIKIRQGIPWWVAREQIIERSSRVDAAARGLPIALFYSTQRLVTTMSVAQAMVTHIDEHDLEAARLYAVSVHSLLHGEVQPDDLPLVLHDMTENKLIKEALIRVPDLLDEPEEKAAKLLLLVPCTSPHPLAVAIYSALRYKSPVKAAVHAASICGHSNNTVPAASMAAALAATINGLDKDYEEARRLESYQAIAEKAKELVIAAVRCKEYDTEAF
jgi:ADP-ribosylglycohydrolase